MLHLLISLCTAAFAVAAPPGEFACGLAVRPQMFFATAPPPSTTVEAFVERLGHEPPVLVGPDSIRDRLDRAFVIHLITKYRVLAEGIVRETTVHYRNRRHEIMREPGEVMTVRHVGSDEPTLEWRVPLLSAARLTAQDALDAARANRWLILDPEHGFAVFRKFLDDEIVIADRADLEAELKARADYYDRARDAFNRRPGRWMVDALWRPHLKR